MTAVLLLKIFLDVGALTLKPLLVSRCPLTERLPGLRSPEGGVAEQPDITTALGCCELAGITPAGWLADR